MFHLELEKLPHSPADVRGWQCMCVFAADFRLVLASEPVLPLPDDAPVPDPLHVSTYREWRRSYHFQVYWSEDSTRHHHGSHSHAQFLCVLPRVGVPRLANTRVSTTWSSCTIHRIRDARECRRRFLGGLIGAGWGVAGTVAATIP